MFYYHEIIKLSSYWTCDIKNKNMDINNNMYQFYKPIDDKIIVLENRLIKLQKILELHKKMLKNYNDKNIN